MTNLSARERYKYESDGTWEQVDNMLYFGWRQTTGIIDLYNKTLKYGDGIPRRGKYQFRASMNQVIEAVKSFQDPALVHYFKPYIIKWFQQKSRVQSHNQFVQEVAYFHGRDQGFLK